MKSRQKTAALALAVAILFVMLLQGTMASAQPTVESIIVGKFTGLKKGNIYHLQNGQAWKQTDMWTQPVMKVRPRVTIHKQGGAAKMQVEDIDRPVTVERVK